MLEKLIEAAKKFEDINEKLTQVEVVTDQELMKKLMKERKNFRACDNQVQGI